jgi:hypothetical protein
MTEHKWVRLVPTTALASESDFDLAPPSIRQLVAPHFGDGHRIEMTVVLTGVQRVECCGQTIWEALAVLPITASPERTI